jgi:hypothetical protein
MNPPGGNSLLRETNLLGHSVIPPRYGQVKRHKVQAHVMKQKELDVHIQMF